MAFTAGELANIANALIDYNIKGQAMSQVLQDRPLFRDLMAQQKTFPGGKGAITQNVKGAYTTTIQGYTHDDTVTYSNPANIKQATTNWYEVHGGISLTLTELKKAGISVTDSLNSDKTSKHSESEIVVITDLLQDKIDDMMEGWARGFNTMLWKDGTQDTKQVPGLRSFLLNDPTAVGNTFGIDRVANTWWRNRFGLAIDSSTASNLNLINKLQKEYRQLRRFGGKPTKFYAGSDFMDAFEKELRSKGTFTQDGWSKGGKIDASMADIAFKGVAVEYDPTLDDNSMAKYGFWLDLTKIKLYVMEGEDRKIHTPARGADKYVMYRAMTWTGGLLCTQLNAQGVYSIL